MQRSEMVLKPHQKKTKLSLQIGDNVTKKAESKFQERKRKTSRKSEAVSESGSEAAIFNDLHFQ